MSKEWHVLFQHVLDNLCQALGLLFPNLPFKSVAGPGAIIRMKEAGAPVGAEHGNPWSPQAELITLHALYH